MPKLLAALLLALATTAHAEFVTGNNLLASLKKADAAERAAAIGYIVGVADTLEGSVSCLPKSVTVPQVVDLVVQWLEHNPRLRHNSGDREIGRAHV